MKLGPVLSYKDVDEAEKLEGKKVVASENLYLIEDEAFCREYAKQNKITLAGAKKGLYPFAISKGDKVQLIKVQFIREVIEDEPKEPRYAPYDLSDKEVRDSLRGRWYTFKDDRYTELAIDSFRASNGIWTVDDKTAEYFFKYCIWLDGTQCGRRVE